jgi:hypothetical protein
MIWRLFIPRPRGLPARGGQRAVSAAAPWGRPRSRRGGGADRRRGLAPRLPDASPFGGSGGSAGGIGGKAGAEPPTGPEPRRSALPGPRYGGSLRDSRRHAPPRVIRRHARGRRAFPESPVHGGDRGALNPAGPLSRVPRASMPARAPRPCLPACQREGGPGPSSPAGQDPAPRGGALMARLRAKAAGWPYPLPDRCSPRSSPRSGTGVRLRIGARRAAPPDANRGWPQAHRGTPPRDWGPDPREAAL